MQFDELQTIRNKSEPRAVATGQGLMQNFENSLRT